MSRIDIARATGLSKGGVTTIISELLDLGLVTEIGTADSRGGKKPILLEINSEGCFSIVVDWTRTECSVARVDASGGISSLTVKSYTEADTPDTIISFIISVVQSLLGTRDSFLGICVVAPGPIDRKNGVILNPPNFHGWKNIDITGSLGDFFHCTVFLENVANAHGIAEKNIGLGRNCANFIHIIVDEGIGAAVIENFNLHLGRDGFGNELGHISINLDGPVCSCGNKGCLELYASLPALLRRLKSAIEIGIPSGFFDNCTSVAAVTWEDVVSGFKANDPLCCNLMKKEAEYLGSAIVTAINLFEPQVIILGSKITKAGINLIRLLEEELRNILFSRAYHEVTIHLSEIENASLSGGGFVVWEHFIKGNLGAYEAVLGCEGYGL